MQPRGRAALGAIASCLLGSAGAEEIWLTSIQPFTGGDWDAGISMRIGGEILLEEINKNPNILPNYTLKVAWQDGRCSADRAQDIFLRNIYNQEYPYVFAPGVPLDALDVDADGTVDTEDAEHLYEFWSHTDRTPVGILGPGCSGGAMGITKAAFYGRMPVVSNSASRGSLSDRASYPNFFRTIIPDSFFAAAWVATAKNLGHTRISASCGESAAWASDVKIVGEAAADQGVTLEGQEFDDLGTWRGYQIGSDSISAAGDAASLLKQGASDGYVARFVILQMYEPRVRLLMCAAYQIGYKQAIWMLLGWFTAGWWYVAADSCSAEEVTYMARFYIGAIMQSFRSDMGAPLDCSTSMTAQGFQDEWLSRQGAASMSDLGKRPEGYTPAFEAATTADAVCVYALTLHKLLEVDGVSHAALKERTVSAYASVFSALSATDFSGVIGQVKYAPGSPDPDASVIIEQFQDVDGYRQVLIGSFLDGVLTFSGANDLKFGLPGEADVGALPAAVASFATCTGEETLDFETNVCEPCANVSQVWLQSGKTCVCAAGYFTDSNTCQPCAAGKYNAATGSQLCSFCRAGEFSLSGASACERCPVGRYATDQGMSSCTKCTEDSPELWTTLEQTTVQGNIEWIPFSGAQSSTSCACVPGAFMDASGQCVPCPQGMICPGPGVVEIVAGFMIQPLQQGQSLPGDIQVFLCISSSVCPGSSDLYSWEAICGTRYGIACGLCPAEHYPADGGCEPCLNDSDNRVARILVFVVSPLLALSVYVKTNRENLDESDEMTHARTADRLSLWLGGRLKAAQLDFIGALRDELYIIVRDTYKLLLDFVQTLGLFSTVFNEPAGPIVLFASNIGKFLILDTSSVLQQLGSFELPAGCMIGSDFLATYYSAFCLPLWVGIMFAFNLTMYMLVWPRLRPSIAGCRLCLRIRRRIPAVRITIDKTVNAVGAILFTFFIGLTSMSTSLFVTYLHPGGERSLRRYPSVLWGDANWNKALPLGIIGLLFYTIFVVAGAIWICLRAPHFAHVQAFRVRYYFLLDGYRPQAWYWGAVLLIKALIINLIFVAFDTDTLIVMSSLVVFVSFLCLKFLIQPWPQHTMNIADTTYSIAMCIILPAMYIHNDVADVPVMVTQLEEIAVLAPFVVTGLCIYRSVYRFTHKTKRGVSWLKKSMRLQLMMFFTSRLSLHEFNRFIWGLEDHDRAVLWQAMHILYARLLKWQAGPALSQQAVIVDADCYQVVNNGEMLKQTFKVAIQEGKDNHVFHEHAVVQHVYESLLRSCMEAGGNSLNSDCFTRCNQVFAMLDKDDSGFLSIQEFTKGAVASSLEVTEEEAMKAFQLMDLDDDGSMSRQEFTEHFIGICIDPFDPDVADERRLMLQHALLLPSESNASAQADAATRARRKLRILSAAVRIQRLFRRFRYGSASYGSAGSSSRGGDPGQHDAEVMEEEEAQELADTWADEPPISRDLP